MTAYEFQASIKDGIIHVPTEYKNKVPNRVRVILLPEDTKKPMSETIDATENFSYNAKAEYLKKFPLMDNPLHVEDFTLYGRDELHER